MIITGSSQFAQMDELSSQGVPFLFLIDFLGTRVEIYTEEEIELNKIHVKFRNFRKCTDVPGKADNLLWKSFPETLENYAVGFEQIQKNLRLGNSYLTNYTRKTKIETNYSLEEIFYASEAKYKILYKDQFVCFSPETFIEIKDGIICTHPMKGTIEADTENAVDKLKTSIKEKAEHYTVVDLLRNDLSIVADEVQVDHFQKIDLIKTRQRNLYAMSSEISGQVKEEFRGKLGSIMRQILPAGSILGAPKKKTLETILLSEGYDRGFYTGVCGWFDGKDTDSCVMIRFIENENGNLYFKSGGGITHLSKLEEEYEEMKNKIYVPFH